jgi:hypothetical protein
MKKNEYEQENIAEVSKDMFLLKMEDLIQKNRGIFNFPGSKGGSTKTTRRRFSQRQGQSVNKYGDTKHGRRGVSRRQRTILARRSRRR